MTDGRTVHLVGATGVVGREMLRVLEQRDFPVATLRAFASARSAGTQVPWRDAQVTIEEATPEEVGRDADLVLLSAGSDASRVLAPAAAEHGALAVDNSSAFRTDPDIPLVVPEVNGDLVRDTGIVANPNCVTACLVTALKPLEDAAGLVRVSVATYQAVSGGGQAAVEDLESESAPPREGPEDPAAGDRNLPRPLAFNVVPRIPHLPADGSLDEQGFTGEESKVMAETRKILGRDDLPVAATCARVPVLRGHAMSVSLEFERDLSPQDAHAALEAAPGVTPLGDDDERWPTPRETAWTDDVWVGRIRRDPSAPDRNALVLWLVGDNLRKGAALNAVQVAEHALLGGTPAAARR